MPGLRAYIKTFFLIFHASPLLSFFQLLVTPCCSSKAPISLGFVLNSRGSMSEEVEAVKSGIRTILNLNSSLVSNFIVVAFSDPNLASVHNSSDRTEIEENLEKMKLSSYKDCPEMAMLGLRTAVERSDRNSVIIFLSDASAKDYFEAPTVIKRAKEKNVTIIFFITGCCNNCMSYRSRVYNSVAKATGGRLYRIKRVEAQTVRYMRYM